MQEGQTTVLNISKYFRIFPNIPRPKSYFYSKPVVKPGHGPQVVLSSLTLFVHLLPTHSVTSTPIHIQEGLSSQNTYSLLGLSTDRAHRGKVMGRGLARCAPGVGAVLMARWRVVLLPPQSSFVCYRPLPHKWNRNSTVLCPYANCLNVIPPRPSLVLIVYPPPPLRKHRLV